MGIIVDLIIIAMLIIFIVSGYKRGFTGSIIKLVSFGVALILAFSLYKPVAKFVKENTEIEETIQETIISTFSSDEVESDNASENLPETIIQNINNEIENATAETKNNIVEQTAVTTTDTIINVGSGLAIFIAVRLILFIIGLFAQQITKLPILKQIDRAGGMLYGFVEGMVIIFIVLGVISLVSVAWPDNFAIEAIVRSTIGSALYNNNIVLNLLF